MVEAGEVGGKLGETLEMSATYLEKQVALKQKIKSAFAYPVIVTVMCFMVVTFLLAFVIPVFSKLYSQVHAPMPGPTLVLIALSGIIRHWWWAMIIVVGVAILAVRRLSAQCVIQSEVGQFQTECAGLWEAQSDAGFVAFYADIRDAFLGRRVGDKVAGYGQCSCP